METKNIDMETPKIGNTFTRTLTITRNKTSVGCLGKIKLYIEDYTAPEITILDTPCRLLGTLKNGETQSFEITEEAVKIFAIFDNVSKNYCNEYYPIPAGIDPVTLSGQCKFNPTIGNAFRFDDLTDEEALANRRKGKKKGVVVYVAAIVAGLIIGLLSTGLLFPEKDKTFTEASYSITLTNRFEEDVFEGYEGIYEKDEVLVMISKETFASLGEYGSISVTEYNQIIQKDTEAPSKTEVRTEDGLCYYDHTYVVDGENYTYYVFAYKGSDAFWLVQFVVFTEDAADLEADILAWAKSFAPA